MVDLSAVSWVLATLRARDLGHLEDAPYLDQEYGAGITWHEEDAS
jgi:hypothetical protein